MINSYEALAVWITSNVVLRDNETVLSAACWFVARRKADEVSDFTGREVGLLFLNGIPPMTAELVTEYLEGEYDVGNSEIYGEITSMLEQQLNLHFYGPTGRQDAKEEIRAVLMSD